MNKKITRFVIFALVAVAIVLADQVTKLLVLQHIPEHGYVKVIPGLVCFTYVQNFGAAFSSFEGMQWLFALVFLVMTAGVLLEYFWKNLGFNTFERWCIVAIYGGGLGNMIDRMRYGYVVDMIATEFIDFPVFNVADIFITCGCIAMMVSLLLFNKNFWKEEKK